MQKKEIKKQNTFSADLKLVNVFDKKSTQIRQDVTILVFGLFFKLTNVIKNK